MNSPPPICLACQHSRNLINGLYCAPQHRYVQYSRHDSCLRFVARKTDAPPKGVERPDKA